MRLDIRLLNKLLACQEGLRWYESSNCDTCEETIERLIKEYKYEWARWLISRILSHENQIRLCIFASKNVLIGLDDVRLYRAIDIAEDYLANNTMENKIAAYRAYNDCSMIASQSIDDHHRQVIMTVAYTANSVYTSLCFAGAFGATQSTIKSASDIVGYEVLLKHGIELLRKQ